jgi:dTDP-4-dehydrorhamnose reductase
MRVLLTGAAGQLGRCFVDRLPKGWVLMATDSQQLDITDFAAVVEVVTKFNPDAIVNAAAYTAVDKAETDQHRAALINVIGPQNLALAANVVGARLVHISTDYVFDGEANIPYDETAITNPLGVYGQTKLDGEIAVSQTQPEAIIVRTAWVFSEYGNNFVRTMLRLGEERDVLSVVADQFGCPTYAGDIAQVIIVLLDKNVVGGLYHFCGNSKVAWNEFAEAIFESALKQGRLQKIPVINAISTEQYPTQAKRPKFSVLNCDKIKQQSIFFSSWKERVDLVVSTILNGVKF